MHILVCSLHQLSNYVDLLINRWHFGLFIYVKAVDILRHNYGHSYPPPPKKKIKNI